MRQMKDLQARGDDPAGYTYDGPPSAYGAASPLPPPPGPTAPSFLSRLGDVARAGRAAFATPAGPSDPSRPPVDAAGMRGDDYQMESWLRGLPDRAAAT